MEICLRGTTDKEWGQLQASKTNQVGGLGGKWKRVSCAPCSNASFYRGPKEDMWEWPRSSVWLLPLNLFLDQNSDITEVEHTYTCNLARGWHCTWKPRRQVKGYGSAYDSIKEQEKELPISILQTGTRGNVRFIYRTHPDLSHMVVYSHVRNCILCIQLRIKKIILKVAL